AGILSRIFYRGSFLRANKTPAKARVLTNILFRKDGTYRDQLRFSFIGYCAFHQNGNGIVNDFDEATLDREIGEMIAPILENLNAASFQRAYQRSMSVQHFEQTVYTG